MDFDKKLQNIMSSYGIPNWTRDMRQQRKNKILSKLFKQFASDKTVAIRGAGRCTKDILLHHGHEINVIGIFDREPKEKYLYVGCKVYRVYPLDSMKNFSFDVLMNGIHQDGESIKKEAEKINKPFLDPVQYLLSQGFFNFFNHIQMGVYQPIVEMCIQYRDFSGEYEERRLLLKEMISYFLTIRDFYSTEKCLDEYKSRFKEDADLTRLQDDIFKLLESITDAFRQRRHKDLILNWIDQAGYDALKDMPYLDEVKNNSLFFTQAYTPECDTRRTIGAVFCRKLPIDDYNFSLKTSTLCRILLKHGYGCACPYVYRENVFPLDFMDEVQKNSPSIEEPKFFDSFPPASILIWKTYLTLLNSSKPLFVLNHMLPETHQWFRSPGVFELYHVAECGGDGCQLCCKLSDEVYEQFLKKILISRRYLDRQLALQKQIMGSGRIYLHMSDHGYNFYNHPVPRFHWEYTRVFLIVDSSDVIPRYEERLFAYKNFSLLIHWLLNRSGVPSYESLFSEQIEQQGLDYYNEACVKCILKHHREKDFISYRGLRRNTDLFMVNRLGEEFYYRMPDQDTNRINDPEFQEDIAYLRERTGKKFLDIRNDDHFKYSRLLYHAICDREANIQG